MKQGENIENLFVHEAFRKQTSPHTRVKMVFEGEEHREYQEVLKIYQTPIIIFRK